MEFKISDQLLQAVANYLASRPYREVAQLITELSKLEKIEKEKEIKKEAK